MIKDKCQLCIRSIIIYYYGELIALFVLFVRSYSFIIICFRCYFPFFVGTTSSLHDKNSSTTPKDGMSRTASGSDINEKNYSIFFPLEKLAKVSLLHSTVYSGMFNDLSIADFASQNSTRMQHKWHSTGDICGSFEQSLTSLQFRAANKTNSFILFYYHFRRNMYFHNIQIWEIVCSVECTKRPKQKLNIWV